MFTGLKRWKIQETAETQEQIEFLETVVKK